MPKLLPASSLSSPLKAAKKLLPTGLLRHQTGKKAIAHVAEALGWVYFGQVSQHDDDHIVVRGFTASAKHYDAHYTVGSLDGYDMILLQRTDAVNAPQKAAIDYRWIILKIDLHTPNHPHCFVSPIAHPAIFYEYFFTKYHRFRQIAPSHWQQHDPAFLQHFSVFSSPDKVGEVANILPPNLTATLAKHFRDIEFELYGDALYVYLSNQHISSEAIERVIKNGVWLAAQFDATS